MGGKAIQKCGYVVCCAMSFERHRAPAIGRWLAQICAPAITPRMSAQQTPDHSTEAGSAGAASEPRGRERSWWDRLGGRLTAEEKHLRAEEDRRCRIATIHPSQPLLHQSCDCIMPFCVLLTADLWRIRQDCRRWCRYRASLALSKEQNQAEVERCACMHAFIRADRARQRQPAVCARAGGLHDLQRDHVVL